MTTDAVKAFLLACQTAKKITELMPELPSGITPRHVHIIDAIFSIHALNGEVRVSDVSKFLGVTRPSITKNIGELDGMGYVVKQADAHDQRVITLSLTPTGTSLYLEYVAHYHQHLTTVFSELDPNDFLLVSKTIQDAYHCMQIKEK